MRRQFWFGIAALCLSALLGVAGAHAQVSVQAGSYPSKVVTIISDAAAGASPDVATRIVAEGLTRTWGQQVVVVNRPGD